MDAESGGLPIYAVQYSKEEIEAEERRPNRKVAVMIGYSGSGYKGMQL
jgi:tRNA pseudouridine38-40 synthase